MEAIAARVRQLAEAAGYNAKTLGEAVGIPPSSADNYWKGKRPWPTAILGRLSHRLNTSVDFLILGDGPPPRQGPLAKSWKNRIKEADVVQVAEIDPQFGLGGVFMDEAPQPEMRSFSRAWLRQITSSPPEELYWARGRGNSMEPTIGDGEIVLIDRTQQSIRDADLVWAFAWGDVGAIKRLRPMPDGSVRILSDNPAVPPDVAHDGELHIFGRVVAVVRRV